MALNVLHVIPRFDLEFGGPTTALIGLSNAQVDAGAAVSIALTFCTGEKVIAPSPAGPVRAGHIPIGPCWGPLRWRPGIRGILRPHIQAAGIVHIHGVWEELQYAATVECSAQRKPYIVRPCGMLDPWSLMKSSFKKKAYLGLRLKEMLRRAARIHCTSRLERKGIEAMRLGTKVIVEPNGVDLVRRETPPLRGSFRARHFAGADGPILLMLGRVVPKKNVETSIDILTRIPAARLAVVGPGDAGYVAGLKARAEAKRVAERVAFVGQLDGQDKVSALVDADLLLMPSFEENFGNVVVEALSYGTPAIVSPEVGLAEDLLDGKVGDVAVLSPEAFGAKVAEWLHDPERRSSARSRMDAFLRDRFEWSSIARRWSANYATIIMEFDAGRSSQ